MSLATVIDPNLLETTRLDSLFENEKKARITVPLSDAVVIRFTKTPSKMHNEAYRYNFEVAAPYAPERLKDMYVVFESLWRVARHELATEDPLNFATHLTDADSHLPVLLDDAQKGNPAHRALWYFDTHQDQRKGFAAQRPRMEPDIFSSEGVERVVRQILDSREVNGLDG